MKPPLWTVYSGYSLLRSTLDVESGLERMRAAGVEQPGLADFESMAAAERFYRVARRLGLCPWIGVTRELQTSGGRVVPVRLFALTAEGYRLLSAPAAPTLEAYRSPALGLSLPPGAAAEVISEEAYFGFVAEEIPPGSEPSRLVKSGSRRAVPFWPVRMLAREDSGAYRTLVAIGGGRVEEDARAVPDREEWRRIGETLPRWDLKPPKDPFGPASYWIPAVLATPAEEASALTAAARAGVDARYPVKPPGAEARLRGELRIIAELGFSGYFLLVKDLVDHARRVGVRVGPGRGSAAASLVAYALGITEVDPLAYGLVFERFLNPDRGGLPDIDLDVDYERRGELLSYLRERWGTEAVAQIGTYGTLGARAVLRDIGRVKGLSPERLTAAMEAATPEADRSLAEQAEAVRERLRSFDPDGDWVDLACRLEGLPRHASVHAAGVVVTPGPVHRFVPVTAAHDGFVTQMEMDSVERLGLVKLDLLGLRTLGVIGSVEAAQGGPGSIPAMTAVPPDDPMTLELLSAADTDGVFQLDGRGVKRLLRAMRPRHLEEIMAVVALFRPGPMEAIPRYLEGRRRGLAAKASADPIERILAETYGVMVYQEQLMAIVRAAAGYTWAEADRFRRAVSKKDHALMGEEETRLRARLREAGMAPAAAEDLVRRIHAFQDYGFNKAHAAAYGLLAYYMAYLKAHFPLAFWAAELSSRVTVRERLWAGMESAVGAGIRIDPPEVNRSGLGFVPLWKEAALAAGLLLVRGVGEEAARRIVDEREARGTYADFADFHRRVGQTLGRRVEQALAEAGALRHLGPVDLEGGQISLFEAPRAESGPRRYRLGEALGGAWPEAVGPIYIRLEEGGRWDRIRFDAVRAWSETHPGPVALVAVETRERGRRLPWTGAADVAALGALRRVRGVAGASRRLARHAIWEEGA